MTKRPGPVFILASNGREAQQIARARGLHAIDWRIMTHVAGRGVCGATVLRAPCWWHGRSRYRIEEIEANLRIGQAVIVDVECPPRADSTDQGSDLRF